MSKAPAPATLAQSARRVFVDCLVRGSAAVPAVLTDALQQRLMGKQRDAVKPAQLRDALSSLQQHGATWQMALIAALRARHRAPAASTRAAAPSPAAAPPPAPKGVRGLSLVGDAAIEREIASGRLALALVGDAHWQFTDLRTRMQTLESRSDLPADDMLRPQTTAAMWIDAWVQAELSPPHWQILHETLEQEFAQWLGAAYHDANQWLVEQGVMPDVDLRPFIRRTRGVQAGSSMGGSFSESTAPMVRGAIAPERGRGRDGVVDAGPGAAYQVLVDPAPSRASGAGAHALVAREQAVLAQMQQVLAREVPGLAMSRASLGAAPGPGAWSEAEPLGGEPMSATELARISPRLQAVIQRAQVALQRPQANSVPGSGAVGLSAASGATPVALEETRARSQAFKQVLKQAAATAEERATIELVAMMFQSILQDDRLPASIRVWFARLQMPVLRVAVLEPDFFASSDHPARLLIDRMGSCALGFDPAQALGEVLEREVKRIVQVIEAYPDTG
ncbi:MAG: DUF1631 family protein, partial [Inhella sp.]